MLPVDPGPQKIIDLVTPSGNESTAEPHSTQISPNLNATNSVTTQANSPDVSISFIYVEISGSFTIVIILVLYLLWRTLRRGFVFKRRKTYGTYTSVEATKNILSVGFVPMLSKGCLTDLRKIGEGFFGEVYKGQLRTVNNGEEHVETVAVKMLKQTTDIIAEEDFISEVKITSFFRHPNILFLIGVCPRVHSNPPWMIFEFMPFGDLSNVLRNTSPQFWERISTLPMLSPEALLSICSQIADGMEHLTARRFVHRDLACRNCLVGFELTVKISDFGMSRDVYTCDYYESGGISMLPIRWMSPESIYYGRFTVESDIWSYGVVLWEVYSYGKQPFFGHTNEEVLQFIENGMLLDIPENCPPEITEIMKLCWRKDPGERIRFLDISNRLAKLKESVSQHDVHSFANPPPVPIETDSHIFC